jgi:hypothetical protein
MDEFFDEIQRLRDAVVDKGLADDWNTLTSSMDALEDTHYAVAAFVASASNPTFPERELGERYLRMYGVMQAFAIQQDSISNFYVALGMSPPDLSPLQHIRDLRIAMAGHPTLQDKPKSLPPRSHFTSQITLDDNGADLITWDGSRRLVVRHVLIPDLAVEQEKYILGLIRQALAQL